LGIRGETAPEEARRKHRDATEVPLLNRDQLRFSLGVFLRDRRGLSAARKEEEEEEEEEEESKR